MNNDLIVANSININAPVSKVWNGLTNPDIIKEYLFGTETITDWQPGHEIIFQGEYQGQHYRDKGVIKEFTPQTTISYSYWSGFSGLEDKPENYSTVSYTVKKIDENTTSFTWTQQGFANEEGYEHSKKGMEDFLKKIKEVMEK